MSAATITFLILGATILAFVSDKWRLDVIALLSLLALALAGVVTTNEALAGFSNPVVLMIAGLFVVGAGLSTTGVADWLGGQLGRVAGHGEVRLLVVVMLATAGLSAFMSSTGTVAILLPVVGTLAQRRGIAPARILLPLAFASLLGGMLTLIGTPPNLVVSDALRESGHPPFRFFSFLLPGLVALGIGIGFMVLVGRRWLPGAKGEAPASVRSFTITDLAREYGIESQLHALRVPAGARLVGVTVAEANLRAEHQVTIVSVQGHLHGPPEGQAEGQREGQRGGQREGQRGGQRGGQREGQREGQRGGQRGARGHREPEARAVVPRMPFEANDTLLVQGAEADVERVAQAWGLERGADPGSLQLHDDESLAELVLPRRSRLAGRTLREAHFRERHRGTVMAVRRARGGAIAQATLPDVRLEMGDTLLVKGRLKHLRRMRDERQDFLLLAEPDAGSSTVVDRPRALAAVVVTVGMLVVMTFGFLPNVMAVLVAAVLMVLVGSVRAVDAYRAVNWESVVLIAGVLPMATALESSGAMKLVVEGLAATLGQAGPRAVLAALFVLTSVLSQVVSNTATTVLVAPIGISMASALHVAPQPLLMGIAIAASTAFSTPIASPVNTIVLGPGGYRFMDFFRVGVPLQLILLVATVVALPWVFPF
jgi:di/tricarboxylate transporter